MTSYIRSLTNYYSVNYIIVRRKYRVQPVHYDDNNVIHNQFSNLVRFYGTKEVTLIRSIVWSDRDKATNFDRVNLVGVRPFQR